MADHGRTLVPFLRGEDPSAWRDAIYYHYQQVDSGRTAHTVARHYGIRTERWKLIYVYDHDFWELYDLQADPEELTNLADVPEHAGVRAELTDRLAALRAKYGETTGPDPR